MSGYIRNVRIFAFLLVLFVSVPIALAAPGSDKKPNIDGIAAEGFQLTNFNVEADSSRDRVR